MCLGQEENEVEKAMLLFAAAAVAVAFYSRMLWKHKGDNSRFVAERQMLRKQRRKTTAEETQKEKTAEEEDKKKTTTI